MTVVNKNLAILTSGGDAQGMNSAVRAVVRTALDKGVSVYAIYEGYQGMVDGGDRIRKMTWDSVGGILQKGGTVIGTARCEAFRTYEGRRRAAGNLLEHEIDALIVIGGDGSLTGANIFRQEWPQLVAELEQAGEISHEVAARRCCLTIVGLVGSIDNDMYGTDMTIGADTALHRIVEAIDAIGSTAASHQRTFVVKVMGRNCGYLALMSAIATGSDWVLIPENPPDVGWEQKMVNDLRAGRQAGRRDSIVVLAEGARDQQGATIGSTYVAKVLEEGLGEEVRVTVLGHVQRGGSPSAFDRNLGTLMGYAAVETAIKAKPEDEPQLVGMRGNRLVHSPLMQCVEQTQAVAKLIEDHEYDKAMEMRGPSFRDAFHTLQVNMQAGPGPRPAGLRPLRLAVLNAGAPAPGMNTAVRAAVRIGLDHGHIMLGVGHGFEGLIKDDVKEMTWMSVAGWAGLGGSELGTNRKVPDGKELYAIARNMEKEGIQGLLMIGGWTGYQAAHKLYEARLTFPAFNIPIVCMPATINNNLPGSELSIGADTALNNIVEAVDKIKQTAVALRRCYVVEVMGRQCGYLAMMSGLATGAERVYLNEEGVKLRDLLADLEQLSTGFKHGKRLGLLIRNEEANPIYTTGFMCSLFEEEGGDLFDVRQTILGHVQQGGDPSPFDRVHATRLAVKCVEYLIEQAGKEEPESTFIGLEAGKIQIHLLEDLMRMMDEGHGRPKKQWWMDLRPIAQVLAQPMPPVSNSMETHIQT
jgi:6-phosphofructokinase 1